MDAWDYHFYSNYRSAIIESGTAFEVFIYDYIRKGYLLKGKSEDEIEKIFETGFKNLVCDHIRVLAGIDFCKTPEYDMWNRNAYEKRNQVVHRGFRVSDLDSNLAITKVGDTIRFIHSMKYV